MQTRSISKQPAAIEQRPAIDTPYVVPPSAPARWLLYLLECRGGSLYAGITNNLDRRLRQHLAGSGARFTRSHPPVALVGAMACEDRSSALRAEAAIRRLRPAQKRQFIQERCALEIGPCRGEAPSRTDRPRDG